MKEGSEMKQNQVSMSENNPIQVEINPEVYKQLKVNRAHFLHSLEHDVQPAFGANIEDLNDYLLYGIIPWSPG